MIAITGGTYTCDTSTSNVVKTSDISWDDTTVLIVFDHEEDAAGESDVEIKEKVGSDELPAEGVGRPIDDEQPPRKVKVEWRWKPLLARPPPV